jgi:hypothetical protein
MNLLSIDSSENKEFVETGKIPLWRLPESHSTPG